MVIVNQKYKKQQIRTRNHSEYQIYIKKTSFSHDRKKLFTFGEPPEI